MNAPVDDRGLSDSGTARSVLRHTAVQRRQQGIVRETGPWAAAVHALLRHLEEVGFSGAPQVVGTGFDPDGRETLTYLEGEVMHPGQRTVEAAAAVGTLLRELHQATATFRPPAAAPWQPWFGRTLGGPTRVIGHGDAAPWNIVVRDGLPVALIDWDLAGPIDPLVELAHAGWLNANLYSDDIAEAARLPSLDDRARQLRALVDAYGLTRRQRRGFVDRIIEFVVHSTANDADEAGVTPATRESEALWGMAWKARSAAWLLHHRGALQNALA